MYVFSISTALSSSRLTLGRCYFMLLPLIVTEPCNAYWTQTLRSTNQILRTAELHRVWTGKRCSVLYLVYCILDICIL